MSQRMFDVEDAQKTLNHYLTLNCPYVKYALKTQRQTIHVTYNQTISMADTPPEKAHKPEIEVYMRHRLKANSNSYGERATSAVSMEKALDNLEKTVRSRYKEAERLETPFGRLCMDIHELNQSLHLERGRIHFRENLASDGINRPDLRLNADGRPVIRIEPLGAAHSKNAAFIEIDALDHKRHIIIDYLIWASNKGNLLLLQDILSALQTYKQTPFDMRENEIVQLLDGYAPVPKDTEDQ